ncbi:MAG TPA: RHS repeat-associated core domain-containing protein, partial [Roseateles sp.]
EFAGAGCSSCGPANRRYAYDGDGRLLRTLELDAQGQPLRAELQRYDGRGRLQQVSQQRYAQGRPAGEPQLLRRYEYSDTRAADGTLMPGLRPTLIAMPSVVTGKERSTRLQYNERGQVLSITEVGWSPIDANGASAATALTRTTTYRYTQRNGHSVLAEVDGPLPNGTKADPSDSDITRFEWDDRAVRLVRTRHPLGWTESWGYDEAGRIASHDATDAATTRFAYDVDGRVLQRTTGSVTDRIERRAGIDMLRRNGELIWQAAWDPQQHLTHQLDASGGQLVFGHDSEGRRVARVSFDAASARALGGIDIAPSAEDSPAPEPAPTLETLVGIESHRGAQGLHERRFDDFGRVVSLTNPATGTAFARYDEADHLVYSRDAHGRSQQLQYDALGRLRAHWHARDGGRELVREFDYRGTLLVAARSPDVTETRRYDAAGRLVERARGVAGHRYVERFAYDDAGRVVLQTLPDGSRVGLEWAADRIRAVRVNGQLIVGDVAYAPASQTPVAYTLGGRRVTWRWDDARGTRTVAWDGSQWRQGELAPSADTPTASPGLMAALLPSAQAAPPPAPRAMTADLATPPAAEAGMDMERGADGLPASWQGWQLQFDPSSRLVGAREGSRQRRYAYDAWGAQALVRDGGGNAVRMALYSGYRRTLEADAQGRITAQYVYLPAPGAWRPVARVTTHGVEALLTDTRGAIVEARTPGGDLTYAARYDDNGALVQHSATPPGWLSRTWGRLRHAMNRGWQQATGFPTVDVAESTEAIALRLPGQAADPDTGLHYNFNRHYDPGTGRYLEPDPAGLAGGDDLYAYADGQPLLGIDPWGLAKIRYFAVDDGVLVQSDGMPNKGHWAFAVYDISDNMDKVLIFDKGGSFLAGGKSSELFKGTTGAAKTGDLGSHYGGKNGYYSPTEFEITIDDVTAKAIIKNLTNEDLGLGMCPVPNTKLLPEIDLGLQGKLNPMDRHTKTTEDNRIVPCKAGATAEEVRFERIKKAIEAHESSDADCAKNASAFGGKKACPAGTWNPSVVPGTTDRAPASYGWVQFIFRTFAGELHTNYSAYKSTLDGLGVSKAQLDNAMKRMDDTKKWYDKIGTATWAADGTNFTAETGLDKTNFEHMQAWSSLKGKIEGAMADTGTPLFKQSQKGKQPADRVNPDLWRANLQKATKLSWTEKDAAGKTVTVEETDAQFTARTTLRDEITDLATKSGTTITAKTLNPYIRTSKNWGESTAGFQVAA